MYMCTNTWKEVVDGFQLHDSGRRCLRQKTRILYHGDNFEVRDGIMMNCGSRWGYGLKSRR